VSGVSRIRAEDADLICRPYRMTLRPKKIWRVKRAFSGMQGVQVGDGVQLTAWLFDVTRKNTGWRGRARESLIFFPNNLREFYCIIAPVAASCSPSTARWGCGARLHNRFLIVTLITLRWVAGGQQRSPFASKVEHLLYLSLQLLPLP